MGIGVRLSGLPELEAESEEDIDEGVNIQVKKNHFRLPSFDFRSSCPFLLCGCGSNCRRHHYPVWTFPGIAIDRAKAFTSYTMATMVIGYILGIILIPKYITQHRALQISAILGIIFAFGAIFTYRFYFCTFCCHVWSLQRFGLARHLATGTA